ncbi:MAG: isoprenylcysteine carboxylmethyltransferase family protein [Oscillospiraceae bacterium]
MLEYEKRLHFDEHYKKLQSLNVTQRIGRLLWGIVGYVVIYAVLKYVLMFIPDFQPWNDIREWFAFCTIPFSKCDCVYITFGLVANCYGSIRLMKITAQNHSVKDNKSGARTRLLTDGCYAKVRHPMYGSFIIMQSSLLLSLRSFIGIILALVVTAFQYFNAAWEEKKKLIPLFGDDYRDYSRVVRGMLLKKWEILILAAMVFFSLIGFII